MSADILYADGGLSLAMGGHVYIHVLREPLTMEGADVLQREAKQMFARYQGRYVSLSVIEPTAAARVDPKVRDATAKLSREYPILAAAIIIEGSGFRSAAARAVIAGIYFLNKNRYPHKICATVAEGAAWLMPFLSEAGLPQTAAATVADVETARGAIRPVPENPS